MHPLVLLYYRDYISPEVSCFIKVVNTYTLVPQHYFSAVTTPKDGIGPYTVLV